ncbi:MAG: tetratricopeptide repeat protein, partial [Armatimonadia bacterium]|nr:tetratricopeptide repeat protein [Armatimonadia bacterium]
ALMRLERYDEAAQAYERAFELDPSEVDPIVNKGAAFSRAERLDEAEAEYRRAIALGPDNPRGYMELGSLLLQDLDQPERALEQYRRAVEVAPDSTPAHYRLAGALKDRGRIDGAIEYYGRAVELDPDRVWNVVRLCDAYIRRGDIEAAFDVLRDAGEAFPDDEIGALAMEWAYALTCSGDLEQARERLAESESKGDDEYRVVIGRASVRAALGDYEEAIAEARRGIELEPDGLTPRVVIGTVRGFEGRFEEAEAPLLEALEEPPEYAVTRLALAWCLARMERQDEAREQLAQVHDELALPYRSTTTYYFAGLAYRALGDTDRANEFFRTATQRWPKHPWSEKMRGMMQ